MPWFFPWTDVIILKAYRYILNRYLGFYISEKLLIDQLDINLNLGKSSIKNVHLNIENINNLLQESLIPLDLHDGFINSINFAIPWSSLFSEPSEIEIDDINLIFKLKTRVSKNEMNLSQMTNSLSLVKEYLQSDLNSKEFVNNNDFEGLELFAKTLESIMTKINFKINNINFFIILPFEGMQILKITTSNVVLYDSEQTTNSIDHQACSNLSFKKNINITKLIVSTTLPSVQTIYHNLTFDYQTIMNFTYLPICFYNNCEIIAYYKADDNELEVSIKLSPIILVIPPYLIYALEELYKLLMKISLARKSTCKLTNRNAQEPDLNEFSSIMLSPGKNIDNFHIRYQTASSINPSNIYESDIPKSKTLFGLSSLTRFDIRIDNLTIVLPYGNTRLISSDVHETFEFMSQYFKTLNSLQFHNSVDSNLSIPFPPIPNCDYLRMEIYSLEACLTRRPKSFNSNISIQILRALPDKQFKLTFHKFYIHEILCSNGASESHQCHLLVGILKNPDISYQDDRFPFTVDCKTYSYYGGNKADDYELADDFIQHHYHQYDHQSIKDRRSLVLTKNLTCVNADFVYCDVDVTLYERLQTLFYAYRLSRQNKNIYYPSLAQEKVETLHNFAASTYKNEFKIQIVRFYSHIRFPTNNNRQQLVGNHSSCQIGSIPYQWWKRNLKREYLCLDFQRLNLNLTCNAPLKPQGKALIEERKSTNNLILLLPDELELDFFKCNVTFFTNPDAACNYFDEKTNVASRDDNLSNKSSCCVPFLSIEPIRDKEGHVLFPSLHLKRNQRQSNKKAWFTSHNNNNNVSDYMYESAISSSSQLKNDSQNTNLKAYINPEDDEYFYQPLAHHISLDPSFEASSSTSLLNKSPKSQNRRNHKERKEHRNFPNVFPGRGGDSDCNTSIHDRHQTTPTKSSMIKDGQEGDNSELPRPSPFTKRKVLYENKQIVLPGTKDEMSDFMIYHQGNSLFSFDVYCPKIDFILPSKLFYEALYQRVYNDLLLWVPSSPFYDLNYHKSCQQNLQSNNNGAAEYLYESSGSGSNWKFQLSDEATAVSKASSHTTNFTEGSVGQNPYILPFSTTHDRSRKGEEVNWNESYEIGKFVKENTPKNGDQNFDYNALNQLPIRDTNYSPFCILFQTDKAHVLLNSIDEYLDKHMTELSCLNNTNKTFLQRETAAIPPNKNDSSFYRFYLEIDDFCAFTTHSLTEKHCNPKDVISRAKNFHIDFTVLKNTDLIGCNNFNNNSAPPCDFLRQDLFSSLFTTTTTDNLSILSNTLRNITSNIPSFCCAFTSKSKLTTQGGKRRLQKCCPSPQKPYNRNAPRHRITTNSNLQNNTTFDQLSLLSDEDEDVLTERVNNEYHPVTKLKNHVKLTSSRKYEELMDNPNLDNGLDCKKSRDKNVTHFFHHHLQPSTRDKCNEDGGDTMMSLALKSRFNRASGIKESIVTISFKNVAMKHKVAENSYHWYEKVCHFFGLPEETNIVKVVPLHRLNQIHLQFDDCAIIYKPVLLPYHVFFDIGSLNFSNTSLIIPKLTELKLLIEESSLYLSNVEQPNTIDLSKDYCKVASVGLFEISTRKQHTTTNKEGGSDELLHTKNKFVSGKEKMPEAWKKPNATSLPTFEMRASNDCITLSTCYDSCVALLTILTYYANDGDLILIQNDNNNSIILPTSSSKKMDENKGYNNPYRDVNSDTDNSSNKFPYNEMYPDPDTIELSSSPIMNPILNLEKEFDNIGKLLTEATEEESSSKLHFDHKHHHQHHQLDKHVIYDYLSSTDIGSATDITQLMADAMLEDASRNTKNNTSQLQHQIRKNSCNKSSFSQFPGSKNEHLSKTEPTNTTQSQQQQHNIVSINNSCPSSQVVSIKKSKGNRRNPSRQPGEIVADTNHPYPNTPLTYHSTDTDDSLNFGSNRSSPHHFVNLKSLETTRNISRRPSNNNHFEIIDEDASETMNEQIIIKPERKIISHLANEPLSTSTHSPYHLLSGTTKTQNKVDENNTAGVIRKNVVVVNPLLVENFFAPPTFSKYDHLKTPSNFPDPVERYSFDDIAVKWELYGGHDFDTNPDDCSGTSINEYQQVDLNINDRSVNFKSLSPSQGSNSSPSTLPKQQRIPPTRRKRNRDSNILMEIHLNKIRFLHEKFPDDATEEVSRQVLSIQECQILDKLSTSRYNKFLYLYVSDKYPRKTNTPMVLIKALHTKPEIQLPHQQECSLRISLQPIRLNMDQEALIFLRDFFQKIFRHSTGPHFDGLSVQHDDNISLPSRTPSYSDIPVSETHFIHNASEDDDEFSENSETPGSLKSENLPKTSTFFRPFIFAPEVPIKIDYKGKFIDFEQGTLIGLLMALAQLNCSEIRLKKFYITSGILGFEKLLYYVLKEWFRDIKNNQLKGILSGVGPMHSFIQIGQGIRDLVSMPIQQYKKDKRLMKGLKRGASSFTSLSAISAIDLSYKMVDFLKAAAETTYTMLSPEGEPNGFSFDTTIPIVGVKSLMRYPTVVSSASISISTNLSFKPTATSNLAAKHLMVDVRPLDIREGVSTALNLFKEGFSQTAVDMIKRAASQHEKDGLTGAAGSLLRDLPRGIMRPALATAKATHTLLHGVKHSLVPEARKESLDKWKHYYTSPTLRYNPPPTIRESNHGRRRKKYLTECDASPSSPASICNNNNNSNPITATTTTTSTKIYQYKNFSYPSSL